MATNYDGNDISDDSNNMPTGDKNPKEDNVISDEVIERNFKTFRSYIETCVKVTDLIAFYDLFTTEQRKKLRQVFKTDPTAATGIAFDDIVLMDNQPDKFMRLLVALRDAGYPKIERILRGQLIPVGRDHRQTIHRASKDIYQNLIPKEVLPHLLSRGVISEDDYEEVMATQKNSSTRSAAIDLLMILPNRHRDWYKYFIEALVSSSHEHLAKTIDEDLTTRIIENRETEWLFSVEVREEHSCESPTEDKPGIMLTGIMEPQRVDYLEPLMHASVELGEWTFTQQTSLDMAYTRDALCGAMKTAEEKDMAIFTSQGLLPPELGPFEQLMPSEFTRQVETRRRTVINDKIKELGTLLPKPIYHDMRQNEGSILKASVDYIKKLRKDLDRHRHVEDKLRQAEAEKQQLLLLMKANGMNFDLSEEVKTMSTDSIDKNGPVVSDALLSSRSLDLWTKKLWSFNTTQ